MRAAYFLLMALRGMAAASVAGTCGFAVPSAVPDCQNNDCGGCGNSCCKLAFEVAESPTVAANLLNQSIRSGGPDGAYSVRRLAEGVSGVGDLRPFHTPVDFMAQVYHTTSGPSHYQDSIDVTIAPRPGGGSVIKAFSVSLVGGAYCDAGQNYKNIVMLMKSISWTGATTFTRDGPMCPPPAADQREAVLFA
mmetsp:Transcript_30355/g.70598  ORF Transcript_30355/g.70598 Transcript_30355/m.70598 type:complete len:192 (+) Transcript_30355:49-624(+)|eukprot:CAMPEP_0171101070 /NCGR_PEP_ID=MMETSP0766_2-20121228/53903_1 /TAXON_ID=439317 /ORGANISM="Gambierdiscus australes, Strain CAWD 149" /LENGTH=191 /DNA_ID=CAMNT_0011561027 /DNA_START=49 /DNA_END=624 /DNA_ORIENTATION=+